MVRQYTMFRTAATGVINITAEYCRPLVWGPHVFLVFQGFGGGHLRRALAPTLLTRRAVSRPPATAV